MLNFAKRLYSKRVFPIVHTSAKLPIYIFAELHEEGLLQQLENLANSGVAEHYISVMPDVHLGKGATVGTVFASRKYICPNAVGVDIGCGMCAVPVTGLTSKQLTPTMKNDIFTRIKQRVPTGFNMHAAPLPNAKKALEAITEKEKPSLWLKENIGPKTKSQLGTLGGGNHFLEVLSDEDDRVWLMLHSGSRNIGKVTAEHYDELAKTQMKLNQVAKTYTDLNYLLIESDEGQQYLRDMEWCQAYAFQNRKFMMDLMINITKEVTKHEVDESKMINIHHNYCKCETCSIKDKKTGKTVVENLWITRKGATSARKDEFGIIPGSMGVGSFIVRGKGNPDSWQSCSHGAGRRLSRTKAKDQISQNEFEQAMKGIVCDTDKKLRDEAPQAYKDLGEVMQNQESLVEIVHRLKPLINVKGF